MPQGVTPAAGRQELSGFLKYLDWRVTMVVSIILTSVAGKSYAQLSLGNLPLAALHFFSSVLISFTVTYIWHIVAGKKEDPATKVDTASSSSVRPLSDPEDVFELIKRRRAVYPRDFTGELVSRSHIETILQAATWAPTHGLTEPWRFVVIGGKHKEELIDLTIDICSEKLPADEAQRKVEKLQKKKPKELPAISHYIAICMKREGKPGKLKPEWEEMAAVSCAVQNMWLMATALGLSGYWTSWQEVARDSDQMRDYLNLDDPRDRCLGFFVLGKGDSERVASYRASRAPLDQIVQWRE